MRKFVRRSLLIVPLTIPTPGWALKADADVLVLDITAISAKPYTELSYTQISEVLPASAQTGAEVFVRIKHESFRADLELFVGHSLTGVVLPCVENPEQIAMVSNQLFELEERRGIFRGSIQIIAEIGTAMGVLNSLEIARSSPRLSALMVGETNLYQHLHLNPEANLDKDPLRFMKGQIIVNARAAGLQALGMSYPLSITMEEANESELARAIRYARDMGFKGTLCPSPSWVKICNECFRPSKDELAYYMKVKEVFEDGLRRGLASVPLDGRMIDVPVYRRAQVFIERGEACAHRDMEKKNCRARS